MIYCSSYSNFHWPSVELGFANKLRDQRRVSCKWRLRPEQSGI